MFVVGCLVVYCGVPVCGWFELLLVVVLFVFAVVLLILVLLLVCCFGLVLIWLNVLVFSFWVVFVSCLFC